MFVNGEKRELIVEADNIEQKTQESYFFQKDHQTVAVVAINHVLYITKVND